MKLARLAAMLAAAIRLASSGLVPAPPSSLRSSREAARAYVVMYSRPLVDL